MAVKQADSVRTILLDHLTRDPGLQMRATVNVYHVEDLAQVIRDCQERGEEIPDRMMPVVFSDGQRNWLADGNHTYEAHIAVGLRKMRCLVKKGGYREAFLYALGANEEHGLRRTSADKRRAILAALRDEGLADLSNSEIGRICRVRPNLVSDVRREFEAGLEKVEYSRSEGWKDSSGSVAKAPDVPVESDDVDDLPPELGDPVGVSDEKIEKALADADRGTTGVYDAKGRPVPEHLLAVFDDRRKLAGIRQQLGGIASGLKSLRETSVGARWVDVSTVCKAIDDAQRSIRFGSPYVVCPRCGGSSKWDGEQCKTCHGVGFLPELAYDRIDQHLKTLAEQWSKKGEAWDGVDEHKQLEASR